MVWKRIARDGGHGLTLSCARVMAPTFWELGVPEPLGTPAALRIRKDAGGVFRMNVKLRSCTGERLAVRSARAAGADPAPGAAFLLQCRVHQLQRPGQAAASITVAAK